MNRFRPLALGLALTMSAPSAHADPRPDAPPDDPLSGPSTPLLDIDLVGAERLVRGQAAVFDARVFAAWDWERREALVAPLRARLVPLRARDGAGATLPTRHEGPTLTVEVPRTAPLGAQVLVFEADTAWGLASRRVSVEVRDQERLAVRLDSSLVAPGGRLAFRAHLFDLATRRPLGGEVEATLLDRRGDPQVRVRVAANAHGLASGALSVPSHLRPGSYRLAVAAVGRDTREELEITVRAFEPQAFFASIEEVSDAERRLARLVVSARHADGLPMRGAAITAFDAASGETIASGHADEAGQLAFETAAPSVTATVRDARGESVVVTHERAMPPTMSIALLTTGTAPRSGEHLTFIAATRLQGAPVATELEVELRLDGEVLARRELRTDTIGLAELTFFLPPRARVRVERVPEVRLEAGQGPELEALRAAIAARAPTRCFERGALALELTAVAGRPGEAARDRLGAAMSGEPARHGRSRGARLVWSPRASFLPFPERPDFAAVPSPEMASCLGRLVDALPEPEPGARATFILTASERTETDWDDEAPYELLARAGGGQAAARVGLELAAADDLDVAVRPQMARPGEAIEVVWQGQADGEAMALLGQRGVTIASAAMREGRATLMVPETATGLLTVVLVVPDRVGVGPTSRRVVTRPVFAAPRALEVALDVAARVRPGANLPLGVTVSDRGRPVAGAALAASVLDERSLALSPEVASAPPVGGWIYDLMVEPLRLDAQAIRFGELLRRPSPSPAEQALMRAIFASVPAPPAEVTTYFEAPARRSAEKSFLRDLVEALVEEAARRPELRVGEETTPPLAALLDKVVPPGERLDPWGRVRTWAGARQVYGGLGVTAFGLAVTKRRATECLRAVAGKVVEGERLVAEVKRVKAHLERDAWGTPFRLRAVDDDVLLVSAGPDGVFGGEDDFSLSRRLVLESGLMMGGGMGFSGVGAGGSGSARHTISANMLAIEGAPGAVRERFETTALWSTDAVTGADGRHTYEVSLSDAVTTWRVDVEAVTGDGRFGHARAEVTSSLPLSVDVRLPDALVVGDAYEAKALVTNGSGAPREVAVTARAEGLEVAAMLGGGRLEPGQGLPVAVPLRAGVVGRGRLELSLVDRGTGQVIDSMVKYLDVQDIGAERREVRRVRVEGSADLAVEVPAGVSELSAALTAHRGAPDLARRSLEGLLRLPTGCFEQTSAKNWPNLLVLKLLPSGSAAAARARELARAGYERLQTFEVAGRGFALYPGGQPTTALTAIGLVQLVDAAGVMEVEPAFVRRIARALVERQDGSGRFAADGMSYAGRDAMAVTAYATWALAEALRRDHEEQRRWRLAGLMAPGAVVSPLFDDPTRTAMQRAHARGLGALARTPVERRLGPYVEALVRLAGGAAGGKGRAAEVAPATLYSAGAAAATEVVALTLLEVLRRGESGQNEVELVDRLIDARAPSGAWATTQATVFALRALAELDTGEPSGSLALGLDGRALDPLALSGGDVPRAALPLTGRHTLSLVSPSPVVAEVDLRYREKAAPRRESHGLNVHLELPRRALAVGEAAIVTLGVHNASEAPVAQPTATFEVPPGFMLDEAALRGRLGGHLEHLEVLGRRVELYFDRLAPREAALVPLVLTATTAVDVAVRPPEAFAYYDPEVSGRGEQGRLVAMR